MSISRGAKSVSVIRNLAKDLKRDLSHPEDELSPVKVNYPVSTYSGEYKLNGNMVRFPEWSEEQLKAFHTSNPPDKTGSGGIKWIDLEQIVDYGHRKDEPHEIINPHIFLNALISNPTKSKRFGRAYEFKVLASGIYHLDPN